jgi:hypothetical protein
MAAAGWHHDKENHFQDAGDAAVGFHARRSLYLKSGQHMSAEEQDSYHGEIVTFTGRLYSDFISTSLPVPAGTKIEISLRKARNKFIIQNFTEKKYKLKLEWVQLLGNYNTSTKKKPILKFKKTSSRSHCESPNV